jgi:uncharacterized membrane protein YphA (DoxX/SURF4 family)
MVSIIIGVALVIGAFVVFGPIGLVFAIVGAVLCGWFFSGDSMTEQQKKEHNENVADVFRDMFWMKKK